MKLFLLEKIKDDPFRLEERFGLTFQPTPILQFTAMTEYNNFVFQI